MQSSSKFDFDQPIDRRNTRCVKWDEAAEGELPLWVADMDFGTAPCVQEAIVRRAQHPCYGYTLVPAEYYQAIVDWQWRRHQWRVRAHEILYTIGVVPAIAATLRALTQLGDNVVMLTPAYNCFYSCIRNAGCVALSVPLQIGMDYSREVPVQYQIDWQALDKALAHEKSTVLLMCNPHNPVGRIWSREELLRVAALCQQHGVTVISDEIHCELTAPGTQYVPWGTIGEEYQPWAVVCTSPSKAFNTAGLQNANLIVRDATLRRRIDRAINLNETCDVNPFGVEALMAAYSDEGAVWLDALRGYIWDNYEFARTLLLSHDERWGIADLQATYLMWVDYHAVLGYVPSQELCRRLRDEAKVWLAAGAIYGTEGWLRINLATPRSTLAEALNRLTQWARTNC